jgi:thymidylate synthase (FAD)
MQNSEKNKQAGKQKGADDLTTEMAVAFQRELERMYENFELQYQVALDRGVPKELARCGMPVGRYSQMRASTCLRNWLHFLTLRMAPVAQWEIRQYANAVGEIISQNFPRTWKLFCEK